MAPWAFMRINYLPMTLGIALSFGMVLAFCIAVYRGDVSPYVPFISEAGGKYPEAGLFSMFVYFSSTVGLTTMTVRYLIVDELNRSIDKSMDRLNRSALVIGYIALVGLIVVAAFPTTSIELAHVIGANTLFVGGCIYAGLQTALSFRMTPYYNGKRICYIRLTITILSIIMLILLATFATLGQTAWFSTPHNHWTGGKTPKDKGFDFLLASAIAEWSLAILFIAFYFTFIREFRKVCLHLHVQMLVQHFDDEISSNAANEYTPIIR